MAFEEEHDMRLTCGDACQPAEPVGAKRSLLTRARAVWNAT